MFVTLSTNNKIKNKSHVWKFSKIIKIVESFRNESFNIANNLNRRSACR